MNDTRREALLERWEMRMRVSAADTVMHAVNGAYGDEEDVMAVAMKVIKEILTPVISDE